jgi:hypothetical protein
MVASVPAYGNRGQVHVPVNTTGARSIPGDGAQLKRNFIPNTPGASRTAAHRNAEVKLAI